MLDDDECAIVRVRFRQAASSSNSDMVQMKWSKKGKDWVKSMTVMKKGTNTKMKYQQGQTRLSSQYAKRGVSKFTLRTYIFLLPYQEADHLTFEAGRGVGWVGNFWSARIFFFCKPLLGRKVFPFSFVCWIFFSLKRVSPSFCKNVFTFALWLLQ